jgi:hypothetical protein
MVRMSILGASSSLTIPLLKESKNIEFLPDLTVFQQAFKKNYGHTLEKSGDSLPS